MYVVSKKIDSPSFMCSDDISGVRVLFVAEPEMVEPTVTSSLA